MKHLHNLFAVTLVSSSLGFALVACGGSDKHADDASQHSADSADQANAAAQKAADKADEASDKANDAANSADKADSK